MAQKNQVHGVLWMVLFSTLGPGCSSTLDDVRRITSPELRDKYIAGQAVIVDVRSLDAYNTLHVSGALSIPYAQVADRADELPRDKLVVTYCT